jgi:phosphate transport system protein
MDQKHISSAYDNELSDLRDKVLAMGGKVERMIFSSIKSLVERDTSLAELTIAKDHEVNTDEKAIDERCLNILALRQPTARDLRFITLALKIVTDLERIGDKCANIAKQVCKLNTESSLSINIDGEIPYMAQWAAMMVKESLDAFVNYDADLADKVCNDDSKMNDLNDKIQLELLTYMKEYPDAIPRALKISYISKSLERISDHATNIAEMVIFMIKGKDIRHTTVTSILTNELNVG